MDQLRKGWAWFVRHHFWVLTVVAILIAVYGWHSGASTLQQEFESNKSKIDAQFSAISQVQSAPFKANGDVNEKQQEQIDIQKKSVRGMWQELYDRQRADVLKWPSNLSEQFRTHVEGLKFGDEIPGDLRDHYNNYVRDHFPALPKIVGAELAPEGDGGGNRSRRGGRGGMPGREMGGAEMMGDAGAVEEENAFLVEWLDQDRIRGQLYMGTTPSAKRIWKTQEDLWVYEALLKVIAATNAAAGADRNSNAAVRVIETLEVGQPAAAKSRTGNRIDMVAAPSGDGGGGEFGGEFGGGAPMGGRGEVGGGEFGGGEFGGEFGGGEGMGAEGEGDANLFANRYIGDDGSPLSSPPEPTEAFKRLPIRMQLVMDERWLQQLISECANAPLQVDVQEVRINPSDSASSDYSRSGSSNRGNGEAIIPESEPSMKPVIIQGVIYIFNPPADASGSSDADLAGVE